MAPRSADAVDRGLLALCAVIWLVVLGSGVAATVALVDLGRGHPASSGGSHTPWLLYAVIGVSALVIIGAVPLLVRARREAQADQRPGPRAAAVRPSPGGSPGAPRGTEAPTEKLRVFGTSADPTTRPRYTPPAPAWPRAAIPAAKVDRVWLRCAVVLACAMGAALVAIDVATYLMAIEKDDPAWILYGLAGVITLAMPVVPWLYLRQLRRLLAASTPSKPSTPSRPSRPSTPSKPSKP
jgi:hypothetical protein